MTGLALKWTPQSKAAIALCISHDIFTLPGDINRSLDYLKVIGKKNRARKAYGQIKHKTADEIRR